MICHICIIQKLVCRSVPSTVYSNGFWKDLFTKAISCNILSISISLFYYRQQKLEKYKRIASFYYTHKLPLIRQ